ncbi:adenylate/guanylate cyclase domain-containing protein [Nevskia sp.]|uniref:adenylate/guanylate cyclase domain-containing protein n=1 Tax=Nevskia sp. TaxID=1929292 RepID=UPI003F7051F7
MARDPDAKHRRLAAIVFTDIVGFSAIVNRDEAAGARALDWQRRIVRRQLAIFGGREIETAGDSFLLEFASPYAGLRCIAAIQRALRVTPPASADDAPVLLRASLHVGDVAHRGREVFGDAVNVSARLLPLSPPGGLALSGAALAQLHGRLPVTPDALGECRLKNIADPVPVWVFSAEALDVLPLASPSVNPEAGNRPRFDRRRLAASVAAVLVLIAAAALLPGYRAGPATRESGAPLRIAVLPFASFSSGRDDGLLASGLQDSILTNLARIDRLRVISRTSVEPYRDPGRRKLKEIAQELEVDSIIEGSLQRDGERLMVQVQLIDAATDHHVWAQSYERQVTDLFGVQSAIARDVAQAVRQRFTVTQQRAVDAVPTASVAAWTRYQQALAARDERRLEPALAAVAEALTMDPAFALAHVLQAELHVQAFHAATDRSDQRLLAARQALIRAAELNPDLPELHRGWGAYYAHGRFDLDAAIAEYETALRQLPNDVLTLGALGDAYRQRDRLDEALLLQRRAAEMAPRSKAALIDVVTTLELLHRIDAADAVVDRLARVDGDSQPVLVYRARLALARGDLARVRQLLPRITYAPALERFHYYLGEFDEAIDQVRRQPEWQTGDAGGDAYPALSNLAALYWLKGDRATAARHARQAIALLEARLGNGDPAAWDQIVTQATNHALLGEATTARTLADTALREYCCGNPMTSGDILGPLAGVYAVLGDKSTAIALLARLLDGHSVITSAYVRNDPFYASLRDEPAFKALVDRAYAVTAPAP